MDAACALAFSFDSPDPETTFEIASLLGRSIGGDGLAIGLVGPLGSGKTLFVKGLAAGLGLDPRQVSSPTFVIAQQYPLPEGPETLHHLDLYRLESETALESIGFRDLLGPGQVLAVEWLDRFPDVLGPDRLEIEFRPAAAGSAPEGLLGEAGAGVDSGRRHFRASAWGDEAVRVLRDWQERWARLEAEEAEAGGGRTAGRREAAKLVLVLLLAGLLGVRTFAATRPSVAEGCAAIEPAGEDPVLGAPERDALGAMAVVCRPAGRAPGPGAVREGIAQLLAGGRVDPNAAAPALLENLPGIGPGRAAAIAEARERAPFASPQDLDRVPGIGPRTLEKLAPFLEVDSAGPAG